MQKFNDWNKVNWCKLTRNEKLEEKEGQVDESMIE